MSTIPEGAMWQSAMDDQKFYREENGVLLMRMASRQMWVPALFRVADMSNPIVAKPIGAAPQQPEPTDHRTPSDGPAVAAAEPTPAPAFMVARPEVHGICTVAPFGARQVWGAQA